jgi:hypothetical protein
MTPDTIFISHATPDDNDFVRWLGTRLTGHGYRVWADLFDLRGGTPFWSTIEDALRHHACKVIFVVSQNSIDPARGGIRNELSVADAVKKKLHDPSFIIPVKIDNTMFGDFPIQIHQLNAIDFAKGWGSKLVELLDTLETAGVPKVGGDRSNEFDRWHRTMVRTSTIVENAPEPILTNLLPIISLPEAITFFEHQEDATKAASVLRNAGFPNVPFYRLVVSFADHSKMQAELPPSFELRVRARVPLLEFLEGRVAEVTAPKKNEARKIATSLSRRSLQDSESVAWNLSTTSFYKAGGRPWRIANIREGVCYVGLVFKRIDNARGRDNACCGAQMFLSTGEGVVFKGAVGPWYSESENSFHLQRDKAAELMNLVIKAYADMHGRPPRELFIHGKTWFGSEEWEGFASTVPDSTRLVGVRIRRQNEIKLFRYGKKTVLRGSAIIVSDRMAYLWTAGFTPRLETYPGREVPNPLTVDIVRGEADIELVLSDLMALTKLNFNSASFSDGLPVTLRFADLVGEILTAGPNEATAPLPFKFYI